MGYDTKYGARPLRRVLQKEIEDPLSMEMLKGRFKQGSSIIVDYKDDKFVLRPKRAKKPAEVKNRELVIG